MTFIQGIYIPSKRKRYGIKLFMLCESSTGYLTSFIIYTGATTDYGTLEENQLAKPFEDYKSPSRVVLSLLKPLLNKGYVVTLDNYYTSPEYS